MCSAEIGNQPHQRKQSFGWHLKPDKNNPDRKIKEHGRAELDIGNGLTDFSWKVPVSSLTAQLTTSPTNYDFPLPNKIQKVR